MSYRNPDGSLPLGAPITPEMIQAAFETGKKPNKPKDLIISGKSWRLLVKIREADPSFMPSCEAAIWMKYGEMTRR